MKKFLNILLKVIGILTVVILGIVVISISSLSERVPDIVVTSSGTAEAFALRGKYIWNAFSEVLSNTNFSNEDYLYKSENTILASPGESIVVSNPNSVGSRHNFKTTSFLIEDSLGAMQNVTYTESSNTYNSTTSVEFTTPDVEGTYLYFLNLNYFEKGSVEYSFKLVVSTEPTYNILDLVKYKNTSLDDIESIREISSTLPYSNNIINYTIKNVGNSSQLSIKCEEIFVNRSSFNNNAIAFFTLIPELEVVKYYSDDVYFIYTREELESLQGRSLSDYADNPELWELETFYKEKRFLEDNTKDLAIFNVILDCLSLGSGEKIDILTVDTESFINNTDLNFTNVSANKLLDDLDDYVDVLYDTSLDKYIDLRYKHVYIGAEKIEIPSGDAISEESDSFEDKKIVDDVITVVDGSYVLAGPPNSGDVKLSTSSFNDTYEVDIITIKNNVQKRYRYKMSYINGSWIVSQHN